MGTYGAVGGLVGPGGVCGAVGVGGGLTAAPVIVPRRRFPWNIILLSIFVSGGLPGGVTEWGHSLPVGYSGPVAPPCPPICHC